MKIEVRREIPIEDIRSFLKREYPEYKVKSPWLNKRVILVQNGVTLAQVRSKYDKIVVNGGLNTQNPGILIGVVLGAIFGFIGAFIFVGIAYLVNKSKITDFETEVGNKLQYEYGGKDIMRV